MGDCEDCRARDPNQRLHHWLTFPEEELNTHIRTELSRWNQTALKDTLRHVGDQRRLRRSAEYLKKLRETNAKKIKPPVNKMPPPGPMDYSQGDARKELTDMALGRSEDWLK